MRYLVLLLFLPLWSCGSEESAQTGVTQSLSEEECRDLDKKANKAVKGHKIAICHIPPGNPDNAHTIVISKNAAQTHFDHHGDFEGICGCVDEPGDGEDEPNEGDDGGEGGGDDPNGEPTDTPPDDPAQTPEDDPGPGFLCAEPCDVDADCTADRQACDDLTNCCFTVIQ